jgi:hypothetical protein
MLKLSDIRLGDHVLSGYDEWIVRELVPHGTYSKDGVTLDLDPTEWHPNLDRYIGDWLILENADIDGEYHALPVSWVQPKTRRVN